MSTVLDFQNDVKGYNSFAPAFATDRYSATLASGGSSTITVPSNFKHWVAAFSYQAGGDIWVSINGTAAGPAGATFATTTSQLQPGALSVNSTDVISIKNNGAGSSDIGVVLYAIS